MSDGRDAKSLFEFVQAELSGFNFKDKLVAKTYDGAAVMASGLNGVQALIKKTVPQSLFVHCYAHTLNLVMSQGASKIKRLQDLFRKSGGIVGIFYTFSQTDKVAG